MASEPVLSPARKSYLAGIRRRERFITCMRYAILVALIGLWELAAQVGWIDPFITSSPSRVAATIARLLQDGELFTHIGVTLFETVAGFLIGTAAGTLIAAAMWWSPVACRILDPYLVILNALPKIALGPILIVWIGAGMPAIITMSLLVSVIVMLVTVLGGFLSVEKEKRTLLRAFGASKVQEFTMVVFPGALANTVSALKLGIGMTWVGVIVGEFLVSRAGLGYLIVYGGQVFKLDLVMAATAILCVLAALMYFCIAFLEKRLRDKRGETAG